MKFKKILKDFSYEINHNKKHLDYMNALNIITPRNYEGYSGYDNSKFNWARIEVPSPHNEPTYIIIRKEGKIIGGAVITHQNIRALKYKLKLRIGIIHEIFLDENVFNDPHDIFLGYTYLIDKIIRAANYRYLGVLLYTSSLKAKFLNQAFKGMSFFKIQNDVIMVKELKENIRFPKLKKPLFIPTYLALGVV